MGKKIPYEKVCYKCGKKAERRERNVRRIWTGKYVCISHYASDYYRDIEKNDPNSRNNIIKSLRDRRTGNQDPNSTNAKGDRGEELLCIWKGYTNLNKKNDNYRTRIDCLDENTGEYYQVKISHYDSINRCWHQDFTKLQNSVIQGFAFKSLYMFCTSKDGNAIERIYEIYEKDVVKRSHISIYKYPSKGTQWYEQYRIIDKEELKRINETWKGNN